MLHPKLLEEEHSHRPIEVDRAHQSLASAKDSKSKANIARLHYFYVKELALRLSREKAPPWYDGCPVFIYSDLSLATVRKHLTFKRYQEVQSQENLMWIPSPSAVTVNNNTSMFNTSAETVFCQHLEIFGAICLFF